MTYNISFKCTTQWFTIFIHHEQYKDTTISPIIFPGLCITWPWLIYNWKSVSLNPLYLFHSPLPLATTSSFTVSMSLVVYFFHFSCFFFFFLCGSFFSKSLLNLLQYCFCFMFWYCGHRACGNLSSLTRDWTCALYIRSSSLNHWMAR